MSCAACSSRVEKAVSKVPGVESCSVSLLTNSMGVEGSASDDEIIAAVEAAGRDDVALIGIDSEQGELEAIASGGVFKATVAQDTIAIGEASSEAAISALQGEKTGDVVIPGILITEEHGEEYMGTDSAVEEELAH